VAWIKNQNYSDAETEQNSVQASPSPSRPSSSLYSSPFEENNSIDSQGESSAEDEPDSGKYLQQPMDQDEVKEGDEVRLLSKAAFDIDVQNGDDESENESQNFPTTTTISEEVLKALRQFGLNGLVPFSPRRSHESNQIPSPQRSQDISGDNPDNWKDKSPLGISSSMLTNLLNSFTTRGLPNPKPPAGGQNGHVLLRGMSDAESGLLMRDREQ